VFFFFFGFLLKQQYILEELAQRVDKDDDDDDDDLSQKLGMKFVVGNDVCFFSGLEFLVGWFFFNFLGSVLLVCEEEFKAERIHMRI
jgi:hypothetical protein